MKKLLLAALFSMLCIVSALAQKPVVWDNPIMDYGRMSKIIRVTKVEFDDDKTVLSVSLKIPAGEAIGFPRQITKLKSDGKDYAIQSMTGMNLDEQYTIPGNEFGVDITMTFDPLPLDTYRFDFVMENTAIALTNIHARNQQGIKDSNWRNVQTGDWSISITDDKVIYDCKVWDIVSNTEKKDQYTISAMCGDRMLNVNVGKEKKGRRTIAINGEKIVCDRIVTPALPDYPIQDTNTTIADNHFRLGDSVTIIGWLKDMPKFVADRSGEFSVGVRSIFWNEDKTYSTSLKPDGQFELRFPIDNSMLIFVDWERSQMAMLVEPNETYYLLEDFANDQVLVMGKSARLNNELQNVLEWSNVGKIGFQYVEREGGFDSFLSKNDKKKKQALSRLDLLFEKHPTLSHRYKTFAQQYTIVEVGTQLMQARFSDKTHKLPENYVKFVTENYWNKLQQPYSMAMPNTFFRDYFNVIDDDLLKGTTFTFHPIEIIKEGLQNGELTFTEQERRIFDKYLKDEMNTDEFNELFYGSKVQTYICIVDINQQYSAKLDSLKSKGWGSTLRDIYICRDMMNRIDNTRTQLSDAHLDIVNKQIQTPALKEKVLAAHNVYAALANRKTQTDVFKSNDDLKNLSEGEQILRKILEPYKGKLVLIDIWGTWCTPCKMALANSKEEYERLKDYDLVYLYLANRSEDTSWKNVIKEYNVVGDNVVHYNLPAKQQSAVENFLNVTHFPTYKLVDKDGTVLGVNADPRNLDEFVALLKLIAR